ncbi:MAG: hypothetical protein MSIBF_03785 [Candidatus Altiarchaeales archaeon IMC4]|nr:MAG: hypothetical protein MSIBF_03785 [Candidatus Altiarchaeales archaeon IMC4]
MNGKYDILLDSGIWLEIIRDTDKGKEAVKFLENKNFTTCAVCIAEVERALRRAGEENKIKKLRRYFDVSGCIDLTRETAALAAKLSLEKELHMAGCGWIYAGWGREKWASRCTPRTRDLKGARMEWCFWGNPGFWVNA